MTELVTETLTDGYRWLRVADEAWEDPLDTTFAQHHGGRWNPKGSYPTLYLNENLATARAQLDKMLEDSPVRADDLDQGYVLIVATLPSRQTVADGIAEAGIAALGLPGTYPFDESGEVVSHRVCQAVGVDIKQQGLRGVHSRSAATPDGTGHELAWFPARPSSKATAVGKPIPFREWW